jgi:hypothetical protein
VYFDFRTYFRFLCLALFPGKKDAPRSPRRVVGLLFFFLLFPVFELFTAACLLLDHVLFPGFRKVELTKPLFIVGPHRSGTTYLQRLLAKDEDQFFSFRLWEIVFPSILQKKVLAWVGRVDRLLGRRLEALVRRQEARQLGTFQADLHEMSLFEPDEDDLLLIHTFSTLVLGFFVDASHYRWLLYFDTMASEKDRERIMRFYRACLKRQGYYKGAKRILLSKTPFGCFRVDALYRYFPGCRMIYTIRNPLQAVPSMLDMAKRVWQSTAAMKDDFPLKAWAYDTVKAMYEYPLSRFAEADESTYEFVVYDRLVQHPSATVKAIYEKFGFDLGEAFQRVLEPEDEKQRRFRSQHEYSLDQFGLSPEQILRDFRTVFDRFGFGVATPSASREDRAASDVERIR